ncbi:G-type lectin S-receptor-like serine/threonine-protein kinase RLK1 [Corylus avellana]|uniref:G-type lectin S-receptor-like serine/threonine-protein kinase RLK1 n=1 Tax=Corylus avellana TaxID=13451 RepID=UPI00286C060A|nr:G-type lectin S-receptor-like serine/threonine-protein kinase RLK1 [Corylus avellana]
MAVSVAHTLFFLLLLLPTSAGAQNNGRITVGTSLSTTDNFSWLSPSGDFAFGFRQLNGSDFFLLSIWYNKIPDRTIVWHANGDKPAPRGSKVNLTAVRGLVLTGPQGQELWTSQILTGVAAYGVMNDTGNFVLEDTNFNSVWESFQNSTDTMLPTQIMERGGVLSSRQSETNFSKGKFQLRFVEGGNDQGIQEGNVVLNTINLPTVEPNGPYYEKDSTVGDRNTSSAGKQLVFNESSYIYILQENDKRITLAQGSLSTGNNLYYRGTLNFDGIFTLYSHPRTSAGNESWTPIWSVPNNICEDIPVGSMTGVCGYNSVCKINPQDKRPTCECPTGYSLLDPNDPYGSCKPDFIQAGCKEDKISSKQDDLYRFEVRTNTNWPTSDYSKLKPFTEEKCRNSCLQDCMCAVAIFSINNTCWKKKLPLSNGRFITGYGGKVLLKVRKDNSTLADPSFSNPGNEPVRNKKNQDILILVGSVLLGCSVFVIFILIGAICIGFFYKKKVSKIDRNGSFSEMNLRCLTYKELLEATDGFREELGRGAFGIVYKGEIKMGSNVLLVAVKKLHSAAQEKEMEFKAEVEIIGKTHHKNLVRLIGFCDEDVQRLLVYEFLSHGTLAGFLFGDLKPNWNLRIQIAFGIARGLLYLHEECSTQIIHCDIKPQNILLDEYYNARISDFGLAKLLKMDQSQTQTAIRGTKGYVAPEWFRNMAITAKVDVYSFGVMLLEIICGRRSVDMESGEEDKAILADWAYDCFQEGTLDVLVEYEREAMDDMEKLERFVRVAIWCIQEGPSLRPTMRKVTHMLEGVVDVPIPPCPSPIG